MTREQLEQYKSKKEEIRELEYRLRHLGEGDSMIGNSTIMDYRTGYPQPQTVIGIDWNRYDNAIVRYNHRLQKLHEECEEVEQFVESISDSMTRRIFRMYYIEGMTQERIAREVHIHRSSVSKKISDFLQLSHKSQKTTL